MTDEIHLTYRKSTHAPLIERYMSRENGHETIGEPKHDRTDMPRIDPETGAEYRALGGQDHKYSRDYKVGSSYPENVFIIGKKDGSLTHDELEQALRERNLWRDNHLRKVILPTGHPTDDDPWLYGFMFTPVDRAPRLSRVKDRLSRKADDDQLVAKTGPVVEAVVNVETVV